MKNRKDDIDRYLRGELSPEEMHALEKAALDDPFLSEALEGIENAGRNNFLFDLHRLDYAVHERTRKKKGKHIQMWGWTVGVAATVLLVALSGFYVISLLRDQRAQQLAMEETAELLKNATEPKDTLVIRLYKSATPMERTSDNARAGSAAQNEPLETADAVPEISAADAQVNEVQGVQKDVEKAQTEPSAVSGEPFREPPSLASADQREQEESLAGRTSDRMELQKRSAAGVREVAPSVEVTIENDLTNKPSGFMPAAPQDGEARFKTYLRDALKLPDEATEVSMMTVRFTVEANGTVAGFQVLKGVNQEFDETFVRAIQNGPAWTPARSEGQPVADTVTISFTF